MAAKRRRLIPAASVDAYEARLRAAVGQALSAQIDSVNLTLHRHGLTAAHLTAALNPDGSSRKKAAAAATTAAIVVPLAWSAPEWNRLVEQYLASVARQVATDAALEAADGVEDAAVWGMATNVDAAILSILDRAKAAGVAIGQRVDAAGMSNGDVVANMQTALDSAGSILDNIVGAMGQAVANSATTDLASYVAQMDPTNSSGATKVWTTAGDELVREAHVEADGQEVGLQETFSVGGEDLTGPGDPNGSDENVLNCRCFVELNGV